jgi:hypothetical protein
MFAAQIKEIVVGCDVKRFFLETEIFFVHGRSGRRLFLLVFMVLPFEDRTVAGTSD